MKKRYLCTGLLLAALTTRAQAPAPAWDIAAIGSMLQTFGQSQARAATTDAAGNVFVVGSFRGAVAFGNVSLQASGDTDLFVAKYLPATGTWAWAVRGGGTDADAALGVALGPSGAVYVTGFISSNTLNTTGVTLGATPQAGATITTSADLVLARFTDRTSTATLDWAQVGGGSRADQGNGVAVSGDAVYVAGTFTNDQFNTRGVVFGGTGTTAGTVQVNGAGSFTSADLLLVKYTDQGSSATFRWSQVGGGDADDAANGVAANGSSVYVTGAFNNNVANARTVLLGGAGTTRGTVQVNGASATISDDLLLAKYTDNGASGSLQWHQVGGGTDADAGQGVAVNGASVYITGALANNLANANAVLLGGTGTTPGTARQYGATTTGNNPDVLLAKYTDNGTTGSFIWSQIGGSNRTESGYAVAVSGGSVYVAGQVYASTGAATATMFGGSGTTPGTTPLTNSAPSAQRDVLLAKYTDNGATGTLGWVRSGSGSACTGLAVGNGRVYAVGSVSSSPAYQFGTLSTDVLQGTLQDRVLLAGATEAGTWTDLATTFNGGSSNVGGIATDAQGNLIVAGTIAGQVLFGSILLSSPGGFTDMFVAKYAPATGTWVWAARAGGFNSDGANAVAVSGSSIYVAGYSNNSATNTNAATLGGTGPSGSLPLYGAVGTASTDLVLVKFTDQGNAVVPVWGQVAGGTGNDYGNAVAVSGNSVYVTGSLTNDRSNTNRVVLGGGSSATPGTVTQYGASTTNSQDLLLAKYTDQGNSATFQWSQVGGGTGIDIGSGVAVSGSSVYVAGRIENSFANANAVLLGGSGAVAGTRPQAGASPFASTDLLLAKYQDNGTTGSLGWSQVGGGTNGDAAYGVAASGSSIYVTGVLTNNTSNASAVAFGGGGLVAGTSVVRGATSTNSNDLLLAKYTDQGTTGSLTWAQVGGGSGGDAGNAVAVRGGNVYVAGSFANTATDANGVVFGSDGTTAGTSSVPGLGTTSVADLLLASFQDAGATGTFRWAQVGGNLTRSTAANAVAVSGQQVYVGGNGVTPLTFGTFSFNSLLNNGGFSQSLLARVTDSSLPLPTRVAAAGPVLALYPNPAAHGAATLRGAVPGAAVTVLDALGRRVAAATADANGTAALGGLAPGLYVVRAGVGSLHLAVE